MTRLQVAGINLGFFGPEDNKIVAINRTQRGVNVSIINYSSGRGETAAVLIPYQIWNEIMKRHAEAKLGVFDNEDFLEGVSPEAEPAKKRRRKKPGLIEMPTPDKIQMGKP